MAGLVGEWKFDEGSGITATDSSGYGNNGTINGATWTTGKSGSALSFDGSSSYVEIPYSDSLNVTEAITTVAWIYVNPGALFGYIVTKNSLGTGDHQYALLWNQSNKQLRTYLDGTYVGPSAINSILEDQWYHIAMVWDKVDVRYYVNGLLSGTPGTYTTSLKPTDFTVNIGRRKPGNHYFNGIIDEVMIYNRALSAEEILAHYNAWAPGSIIGTVTDNNTGLPISNVQIAADGYSTLTE